MKNLLLLMLSLSLYGSASEVKIKDNIPGVDLYYVCIDTYVFVYLIYNNKPTGLTQVLISIKGSRELIVQQAKRCNEQ